MMRGSSEDPGASARGPEQSGAGLYVHVPFCSAICPYCDFCVTVGDRSRRREFVDSLLSEIELWGEKSEAPWEKEFDTLYFGGGTPSALSPKELERILTGLRGSFPFHSETRIFFEANPEDVDAESVRVWRGLGVSFLSLGVQSFDDSTLRTLGRRHGVSEGERAVQRCLDADFDTVSVDLIYGIPGTGTESFGKSVEVAASLSPQHVSCYQLTFHEGTPFEAWRKKGRLVELEDCELGEIFLVAHRSLRGRGYFAYEVSNFASEETHRSAHNQKYWNHTPYLGLGPSAHSFDGVHRWWNDSDVAGWESRLRAGGRPVRGRERLCAEDLALESLMLGFRTADGIDLVRVEESSGIRLVEPNQEVVKQLVREGLLVEKGSRLCPTLRGMAVADSLARGFRIEAESEEGQ